MRESAHINTAIELLAECETSWKTARPMPADIILHHFFKSRRFIGSKDRGTISKFVYYVIRHRATLMWHMERYNQQGARALAIAALLLHKKLTLPDLHNIFSADQFAPDKLSPPEKEFAKSLAGQPLIDPAMPEYAQLNFPEWMQPQLESSLGEKWKDHLTALNEEAPVDLRTNTLLATREQLMAALAEEGYDVTPTPHSPVGVRLKTRMPVFTSACFKRGWFEMQDEGSQLVTLLAPVKAGDKVIDFCAGAGGKTLALAAQMNNKGRILAWDTSEKRLNQMKERLASA
ncbi:MAG: class I SAM-dependent methyltransferase, partial [Candidatus Sungbacteria bacterium]|nr:class I SAM-dependent methyltransferase [Candidatus Sungbacteria bacterium]